MQAERMLRRLAPDLAESCDLLMGERDRATVVRAADLALVASGTVTLEVAFHGTPMIVMYNGGRFLYQALGRWLIRTPHLSIPNILAGRRIVPEFMPYFRSTDPIAAAACDLLANPERQNQMRRDLEAVVKPMLRSGAARNAAAELVAILNREDSPGS